MAEKEKEEKEEKDEKQASQDVKKGAFPVKLIVTAAVFLLVCGAGFFAWKSGFLTPSTSVAKQKSETRKGEKGKGQDIGPLLSLDSFIVNLLDTKGKRYLKVKVDLEVEKEEVLQEVQKKLPQVRDTILTLLCSKGYEDISTSEGKFQLRAEITSLVNQHLKQGEIKSVFFSEFIVQ